MADEFQQDVEKISRIEVVPTILQVIHCITGMEFVTVARVTEARWVTCSVLDEIGFGLKQGSELDISTTICNQIRQTHEFVVIENVAEDDFWCKHAIPLKYGFQSYISVPIILANCSMFGTLCAIGSRPARLKAPEIVGMFKLFADLIAKHLDAFKKLAQTESDLIEKSEIANLREKALQISEERYRRLVETQTEMIVRSRPDGTLMFVNEAYCRYFRRKQEDLIGKNFLELIPEPERPGIREVINATLEGRHSGLTEHQTLHSDGSIRWTQWVNHAVRDGMGNIEIQGIGWDITEQKRTQEALQKNQEELRSSHAQIRQLAGRLIKAQEEERRHIARELHDDLNQQIAGISISLSSLKRQLSSSDALSHQIEQLRERTAQVATALRSLSHELHPAVLEHGGLTAALQSLIAELDTSLGLQIALRVPEHLEPIPNDVATCIFRVTQEAIRNISKHAGARHVDIDVSADKNQINLLINDDGRGFEIENARKKGGLGLISMAERVRLLQGVFEARSKPGDGTFLRATLPLASESIESAGH